MKPDPLSSRPGDDATAQSIENAAAEWCARLDAGLSPAQQVTFERWLQADPRHRQLFEQMNTTWDLLDRASEVPEAELRVPPLSNFPQTSRPRAQRVFRWTAGLAAAAAVVVFGSIVWTHLPAHRPTPLTSPIPIEVTSNDFKRLDLPDGSVIRLNSGAQVTIDYTEAARSVHLLQGEAFFEVAKNKERPFIVTARGAAVKAVGTAFNVALKSDQLEVLVAEGKVAVASPHSSENHPTTDSSALLQAGEKLVLGLSGKVSRELSAVAAGEISRALAWRDRRLTFDAAPLTEILAEFNRFNDRQLVIAPESVELRQQRFGGSFRADDPETFIELLQTRARVMVEKNAQKTVLRLTP